MSELSHGERSTRMCAGCRQKDGRLAVLRFVLAGDPPTIVPDLPRRANGRGVSIHPTRRCLAAAARSGALGRGLRSSAPLAIDVDQLADWACGQYARRFDGLMRAAHRAGRIVVGDDRVRELLRTERPALLVVAGDASERRSEIAEIAARIGRRCIIHSDKASLGRLVGRDLVAVLAVTDVDIAAELQNATDCAALLAEAS